MIYDIFQYSMLIAILAGLALTCYLMVGVAMQVYCTNKRGCYCMDMHLEKNTKEVFGFTYPVFFVVFMLRRFIFIRNARNAFKDRMGTHYNKQIVDDDIYAMIDDWDVLSDKMDNYAAGAWVDQWMSYYGD